MSKDAIDFSRPFDEVFGGGDGFFTAGLYRCLKSRFTFFDFKKPGNDSLCLMQELQPLNSDGEPEGDAAPRYWPVGGKMKDGTILVEPVNPVKGEKGSWSAIRFTEANKHDKLFKFSEMAVFMEYAHKNEVDMDAVGNDITAFDDMVLEYGIVTIKNNSKTATAVEVAEGGAAPATAKATKDVVVITGVPRKKAKGGAAKPKPAAKDPEPDEKPAKKNKKKGPEALVASYIEDKIVPEIKADGSAGWMDHKLAFSKYLSKELALDADDVKETMAIYNDRDAALPALLDTLGLAINKDKEFVKKEED